MCSAFPFAAKDLLFVFFFLNFNQFSGFGCMCILLCLDVQLIQKQQKNHSFNSFMFCFVLFIFLSFSGGDQEWRNKFTEKGACTIKKNKTGSVSDNQYSFGLPH